MAIEPKLSHTAAMILQAVNAGYVYGFSVMEMTGLPSGTVYPAMRRLERDELIRSHWEQQSIADAEQRPPSKYYKLTRGGKDDAGGVAEALSVAGEADSVGGGGARMTPRAGLQTILWRLLLRGLALMLATEHRHEWSAEWQSELWYAGRTLAGKGLSFLKSRASFRTFLGRSVRCRMAAVAQ